MYTQYTLSVVCAHNRQLKLYVHTKHINCCMCTKQIVNAVCTYDKTVNVLCAHNGVIIVCTHIRQLMLYVHTTDIKSCVYTIDYLTWLFIKDIVTFPLTRNFNISSSQSVVWFCINKHRDMISEKFHVMSPEVTRTLLN